MALSILREAEKSTDDGAFVRWTWLRSKSSRSGFAIPVLPPEEYEQQMRGVLSVIAAKTGLPLYDLRKKQDIHYGNTDNTP